MIQTNSQDVRDGESNRELAVRYEELRDQVLEVANCNGRGLGWALFVRKGMAAWLAAWRDNVPGKEPDPAVPRGTRVLVTRGQQNEIVTVWTGMVLSHVSEGMG